MKKCIIYGISALACLWSCSGKMIFDDAQYEPDIKLGAKVKSVECEETFGECSFDIVSNVEYTATIVKGAEWLSFTGNEGVSEQTLRWSSTLGLSFTANRGYRRSGRVVLSAGGRTDTLLIKQRGIFEQELTSDTEAISVPGAGGTFGVGITTNLLKKDFHFETVDTKDYPLNGKADKLRYSDGVFSFRVLPSESRDEKTFIVRIYALDDWGEKVKTDITITQEPGRE